MKFPRYLSCILLMIAETVLILGCREDIEDPSQVSSILGHNDISLVLESDKETLATVVGSFLVVKETEEQRFAQPICTGIRIGRTHLLTASHCLKEGFEFIFNPWFRAQKQSEEPMKLEPLRFGNVIRLAYSGAIDPKGEAWVLQAEPLPLPVYVNQSLDYVLFELPLSYVETFNSLGEGLSINSLAPRSHVLEANHEPDLRLWGHPHGAPLTQAPCSQMVSLEGDGIFHDCDALSGSSGGLIGDDRSRRPLGMHLSGPGQNQGAYWGSHGSFETPEEFAARRGCPATDPNSNANKRCVTQKGLNRALSFTSIWHDLKLNAPRVAEVL